MVWSFVSFEKLSRESVPSGFLKYPKEWKDGTVVSIQSGLGSS